MPITLSERDKALLLGALGNPHTRDIIAQLLELAGSGDVSGPGSSTDTALVRFDGPSGVVLQNSPVLISDAGAVTAPQIATPSNPAAGNNSLYFKSDEKLYKLTSAGVESEVGAGGGGGDFLADGSVPMTGDLQMQANNISMAGGDLEMGAGARITFSTTGDQIELAGGDVLDWGEIKWETVADSANADSSTILAQDAEGIYNAGSLTIRSGSAEDGTAGGLFLIPGEDSTGFGDMQIGGDGCNINFDQSGLTNIAELTAVTADLEVYITGGEIKLTDNDIVSEVQMVIGASNTMDLTGSMNISVDLTVQASAVLQDLEVNGTSLFSGQTTFDFNTIFSATSQFDDIATFNADANFANNVTIDDTINASFAFSTGNLVIQNGGTTNTINENGMLLSDGVNDAAINFQSSGILIPQGLQVDGDVLLAQAGGQIAMFGGGPVGQGAAIADATDSTDVIDRLNDLLAYLRSRGDIAT
jgi:hypothetical protein